jgi:hypothetical protein
VRALAAEETVGCGVDLPQQRRSAPRRVGGGPRLVKTTDAVERFGRRRRRTCVARGARSGAGTGSTAVPALRRADRSGKGCEELIEYFSSYGARAATRRWC